MKKNILISLLIGMMGVISFVGCQKNKRYTYKPDDELYEYCAFDSSSYWIYEDSVTHQIDSMVANKRLQKKTSITTLPGSHEGDVLTFSQQLKILSNNTNELDLPVEPEVYYARPEYADFKLKAAEYYTITPKYLYETSVDEYVMFPFVYANIHSTSDKAEYSYNLYTYKYCTFYNNYTIDNHDYKDVKKIDLVININAPSKNKYDTIVCYWSKNVGMIRGEIHFYDTLRPPVVKKLIRYNVVNVKNPYK